MEIPDSIRTNLGTVAARLNHGDLCSNLAGVKARSPELRERRRRLPSHERHNARQRIFGQPKLAAFSVILAIYRNQKQTSRKWPSAMTRTTRSCSFTNGAIPPLRACRGARTPWPVPTRTKRASEHLRRAHNRALLDWKQGSNNKLILS
jgi:hypothetical protein